MTIKILLIGNTGQVGWELQRSLLPLGDVIAVDFPVLDLSQPESIHKWIHGVQPDLIVNPAAYTAVDQAEAEPELAQAVNSTAPGILAEQARQIGAGLIHYSTDYVFGGTKNRPYQEIDPARPINQYGRSKLAGEEAVQQVGGGFLILRTSWVYSLRRPCFLTKLLSWAREEKELRIVDDQTANPTWCRVLGGITALILAKANGSFYDWLKEIRGVYHLAGKGTATRLEWAKLAIELSEEKEKLAVRRILPAKSSDFKTPAQRPTYSALSMEKIERTFSFQVPDWKTQLALALAEDPR